MLQLASGRIQRDRVGDNGHPGIRAALLSAAVGVAYFLAGWLGLVLLTDPEKVAVFWPAAGIATGTLIALGPSVRLLVTLAVAASSLAASLMADRAVLSGAVFALCNAGEPLLAAWLIARWFGPNFNLDTLSRVIGLFAAGVVSAAGAAGAAALAMTQLGPGTGSLLNTWKEWFLSDSLGIVIIAPLLIGLTRSVHNPPKPAELLEGMAALTVLAVTSAICFGAPTDYWVTVLPLALLLPLLLWTAARCRPVFVAAAVFVVASCVVLTLTFDVGRLGDASILLQNRVHAAQAALFAISICALALGALCAERREREAALSEREAQLALSEKTALVGTYVFDLKTGEVEISAGYAAIYGLAEDLEGYNREEWRNRVHPDDVPLLDTRRTRAFAERQREHTSEYRIIRPDGEMRWIESRAFISYDRDGRAERMVGVNIDVTDRKQAERNQDMLIAELDHRVKNVLATIAVITRNTNSKDRSALEFTNSLESRIQSMAEAHALLSRSRWQGVRLADLIGRELAPYAMGENTAVGGPDVDLTPAVTQVMAMVLHELATNAAKYGAFSTPCGRVLVDWSWLSNGKRSAKLKLEWREIGGPEIAGLTQLGYGTSVIRDLIPYELGGTVDYELAADGVRCAIILDMQSSQHFELPSMLSSRPN